MHTITRKQEKIRRKENINHAVFVIDQMKYDRRPEPTAKAPPAASGASDADLPSNRRRTKTPQDAGLRLESVFGYRSYDCRDNLFYTQRDEIVYHVAALAIVLSRSSASASSSGGVVRDAQRFYTGHDDDILCLNLHPHKDIAATGQVRRRPFSYLFL